jgi:hypothetical protein
MQEDRLHEFANNIYPEQTPSRPRQHTQCLPNGALAGCCLLYLTGRPLLSTVPLEELRMG